MASDGDGDGNGDGKKPTFRCLDAARYTVASVVTVLILLVVVKAVRVVLRPEQLTIAVLQGSVFATRIQKPPTLVFNAHLRAYNPSGRARMYYTNISGYLFDNNTVASSTNPVADSFISFDLEDSAVPQQKSLDIMLEVDGTPDEMTKDAFEKLYKRKDATIGDMTLRLDGNIITEITSYHNTTPRWTTYYCSQLVVGRDPNEQSSTSMDYTLCREGR